MTSTELMLTLSSRLSIPRLYCLSWAGMLTVCPRENNEEWASQTKVSNSVWLIFFQIQQKPYFLKNHIRYRNDSFCVVIRKQNAIFSCKNIWSSKYFTSKSWKSYLFLRKITDFIWQKVVTYTQQKWDKEKASCF